MSGNPKQPLALEFHQTREQVEKQFLAHLRKLTDCGGRRMSEAFCDFLTIAAISIQNPILKVCRLTDQFDEAEAKFHATLGKYADKQGAAEIFASLLAITVHALELDGTDFLGRIYMSQEIGNDSAGQFFTPNTVAELMARMGMGDVKAAVAREACGYITINDPACGGGVMLLASIDECLAQGVNPATQICVYAQDIDSNCVHMTYIQLSLVGVPAMVIHGNSLSNEEWGRWFTPVWYLHRFGSKERKRLHGGNGGQADTNPIANIPASVNADIDLSQAKQGDLFEVGA